MGDDLAGRRPALQRAVADDDAVREIANAVAPASGPVPPKRGISTMPSATLPLKAC